MSKKTVLYLLVTILGALSITAGWFLTFNWVEIFTRLRGKEMALSPTSPTFKDWKNPPIELYFDVYLFNWTNPQDFYAGSPHKPHVQQLGPYRFLEKSDKVNLTWHKHNSSLTYRNFATFHFVPEQSNGTLNDMITSVDQVKLGFAERIKNERFIKSMSYRYFKDISVSKTAEEFIFQGYYNQLVTLGRLVSVFFPIDIPTDKIGYLYGRNDSSTYDGIMNIYTGADDISKMGQIHTWNHQNKTVYPDECGAVKGSMGQFFPQNLKPNTTIYMFIANLCRAIPLDYMETVEIHGLKAFKYAGSYRSIDNGTTYPENKCFCHMNICEPSGTINVSPCHYNASIRISYPHFYLGDPSYLQAIEGLHPDPLKHEFFITLEPNSGLPMDVGGGFQANVLIEPIEDLGILNNIPKTLIPLMWAEERVRVPKEIADQMALVPRIALAGQVVAGVLLAVGLILVFWYPSKYLKRLWRDPKAKSKILMTETTVHSVVAQIKRPIEQCALLKFRQISCTESQTESDSPTKHKELNVHLLNDEVNCSKESQQNLKSTKI